MSPGSYRYLLLSVAVAGLLYPGLASAWRHFAPATAADGWVVQVYLDDIERVSALVTDVDGNLYISQEKKNGNGVILKRDLAGRWSTLATQLSKPDGLASFAAGIAFSQEQGLHPVMWSDGDSQFRPLFSGYKVEGLAADQDYLYAVEDVKERGRLLRYDPHTGQVALLRSNLNEVEGVTVCPGGDLYYAEKARNTVWALSRGDHDRPLPYTFNQPGLVFCDQAGLWVSEDATHMARLLLVDTAGEVHTVLSHLRSAQAVMQLAPGQYLVAEQGRNRILKLQRQGA